MTSWRSSPAAHIRIETDGLGIYGDVNVAKANVTAALKAVGHVADDAASEYKLSFKSAAGATHTFTDGPFPRTGEEHQGTSTDVTATLTQKDQPIWTQVFHYGAGGMVVALNGKSVDQELADEAKPKVDSLKNLHVPAYLVKAAGTDLTTLGGSTLTHDGFVAGLSPASP